MNVKICNGIHDKIHSIYQKVADVKMKNAADEFRYLNRYNKTIMTLMQ